MNRKQVVGTEPNSTKVTSPLEQNSPKANAGATGVTPAAKANEVVAQTGPVAGAPGSSVDTKIVFSSATIGSRENARTKDYFAEQNQKRRTKEQARATAVKRSLAIAGGVAGVALLVGIGIWVIVSTKQPEMPTSAEGYDELTEAEKIERNSGMAQETYNTATQDSDNTGEDVNSETVMGSFQEKIDSAQNVIDAHVARVATMQYLNGEGDYAKLIELGEQITDGTGACVYPGLDLDSRMTCHNLMALAYQETGNEEMSQYHMDALMPLMDERIQMEYGN